MSKEISAPLIRTARLLDLVPYIYAHQGISLAALSSQFHVSEKQMISDLTTLWMCGLPGYTPLELMELDFDSGFVSIGNASTLSKPRAMTTEEAVALLVGLDSIRSEIYETRKDLVLQIDSLSLKISTSTGLPLRIDDTTVISTRKQIKIGEAISTDRAVKIQYHSIDLDQASERTVLPITLYESSGVEYLHGFCYKASAFRTFRIDRVLEIEIVDKPSLEINNNQQWDKTEFEIAIIKPSRTSVEVFGVSKQADESLYKVHSFSKQWILRSVISTGVELRTPPDLRQEISSAVEMLLGKYED